MSGVFLSYSRNDREFAEEITHGFRAVGVVVWWDEDMRSIDWHQELERKIVELTSLVVLWTPSSISSDHVKDEARLGLETGKLINVIVGVPKPPFPYDRVNGLPLDGWTGREPHRGWTRLIESIEQKIVEKGVGKPGELTAALARHEENRRLMQQTLARAQETLEEAQARETEIADAAQSAHAAFTRAEEQQLRVIEMRATHLILSAAQQEYETARAAKEDADRALRASKFEIKGAARNVAMAIAALQPPGASQRRAKPVESATLPKSPEPPPPDVAADPDSVPAPNVDPVPIADSAPVADSAPIAAPFPVVDSTPPADPAPIADPTPLVAAAPIVDLVPVIEPGPKPGALNEPEPTPASAPGPASTAAAKPRSPLPIVALVCGIVALGVVGVGAMLALNNHGGPPLKPESAPASKVAVPSSPAGASAPVRSDPTAEAVKAAAALAGAWAPEGLSCDSPVTISVKDGAVSMTVAGTTATSTIGPSPSPGVTVAKAEDGGAYTYTLGSDQTLSMVDAGGQTTKMTRCAG